MKLIVAILSIVFSSFTFAHHFTGAYQTQQGLSISIQHSSNGQMQGTVTAQGVQVQLQGQGSQQGAYGTLSSQQGVFGFQAQLSPDGQMLQMMIFPMNQQGQPDQANAQQIIANRVGQGGFGSMPVSPMPQPPMPQPPMPSAPMPNSPMPNTPISPSPPSTMPMPQAPVYPSAPTGQ